MTLEAFIRSRAASWDELEGLVTKARGRTARLEGGEILRLGGLYRTAAADLALARRRFPSDPATRRLERLVAAAAVAVYAKRSRRGSALAFFVTDYWRAVRSRGPFVATAAILLLGPALLAALWAHDDPASALAFVPPEFRAAADPPRDAGTTVAQEIVFSSELFTNNIQVTFMAFAAGIIAGIGTGIVLAFNGILLGTIFGLALEAGNGGAFFEFVIPHGPLELTCIVVAAGAGLRLGWALVEPGDLTRGASLAREGPRGVLVVLGTMPWLVLAGVVEAFIRSQALPRPVVASVGIGLFALFWALVAIRGRGAEPSRPRAGLVPSPAGTP